MPALETKNPRRLAPTGVKFVFKIFPYGAWLMATTGTTTLIRITIAAMGEEMWDTCGLVTEFEAATIASLGAF